MKNSECVHRKIVVKKNYLIKVRKKDETYFFWDIVYLNNFSILKSLFQHSIWIMILIGKYIINIKNIYWG